MSLITPSRPRSEICSRCQSASAPQHHGVGGERILEIAGQSALFAQLGERVAAPAGLEQVGAEQRVVREAGRHEPERLGVVRDDGALTARPRTTCSGPSQSPASTSAPFAPFAPLPPSPPTTAAAKRHGGPSANSSPSGVSVCAHDEHQLVPRVAEPGDVGGRCRRARARST